MQHSATGTSERTFHASRTAVTRLIGRVPTAHTSLTGKLLRESAKIHLQSCTTPPSKCRDTPAYSQYPVADMGVLLLFTLVLFGAIFARLSIVLFGGKPSRRARSGHECCKLAVFLGSGE